MNTRADTRHGLMVVGLMGAKGCGKSTAASRMVEVHGFQRLRLADGLKEMLKTLGLTDEQVDGDQKEVPLPFLCGKTPRHAMQTLGTEWGRDLIGGDLWVNACQQRIMRLATGRKRRMIVVDDVRFPNEVRMIRELGGTIWKIRRAEVEPKRPLWLEGKLFDWGVLRAQRLHPSERHWWGIEEDVMIRNQTGTTQFKAEIDGAVHRHVFVKMKAT